MSGRLTTHVLDTARGRPAAGVAIELRRSGFHAAIASAVTNADGRTDVPLLEGEALTPGGYEIRFAIGAYFAASGLPVDDPPFLDIVPVRFTVVDPDAGYHVPLLVAPGGYSTYRGS
jgi:5-hydroxyisourate hydrolase